MEKKKSFLFRLFGAVSGEASEEEKKAVLKEIEAAPGEGEKDAKEQGPLEEEVPVKGSLQRRLSFDLRIRS